MDLVTENWIDILKEIRPAIIKEIVIIVIVEKLSFLKNSRSVPVLPWKIRIYFYVLVPTPGLIRRTENLETKFKNWKEPLST